MSQPSSALNGQSSVVIINKDSKEPLRLHIISLVCGAALLIAGIPLLCKGVSMNPTPMSVMGSLFTTAGIPLMVNGVIKAINSGCKKRVEEEPPALSLPKPVNPSSGEIPLAEGD